MCRLAILIWLLIASTSPAQLAQVELRLATIVIPEYRVEGTSFAAAVDRLRELSQNHDESGRGVRFAVQRCEVIPLITLHLKDASVGKIVDALSAQSGLAANMGADGVTFARINVETPRDPDLPLLTRTYDVGNIDVETTESARETLAFQGVTFPDSAFAKFGQARRTLTVHNTPANIELVEMFLRIRREQQPPAVNVHCEVFRLDTATARRLARKQMRGGNNSTIRREIVEFAEQGKAELVTAPRVRMASGQRAQIGSPEIVRTVTGYQLKDGEDVPEFGEIILGHESEIFADVAEDGITIDLHVSISAADGEPRYGEAQVTLPASGKEVTVETIRQPRAVLNTSTTVVRGQPSLLGFVDSSANPDKAFAFFVTADTIPLAETLTRPE